MLLYGKHFLQMACCVQVPCDYKVSSNKVASCYVVLCMWFCFFFSVGVSRSKVVQVEFKRFPHKARFESREVQGSRMNHVEHTNNTNYPDFIARAGVIASSPAKHGRRGRKPLPDSRASYNPAAEFSAMVVRVSGGLCIFVSCIQFLRTLPIITPQLVET